jgi:hypothetical protein
MGSYGPYNIRTYLEITYHDLWLWLNLDFKTPILHSTQIVIQFLISKVLHASNKSMGI